MRRSTDTSGSFRAESALELRRGLDSLYAAYNRPEYIHPDPLELVLPYKRTEDQEVAGLIASSLAYGRVTQILRSARRVLEPMGKSPRAFLDRIPARDIPDLFNGFAHRFTTAAEMTALCSAIKRAVAKHGTLEALFAAGLDARDATVIPALSTFVDALRAEGAHACPSLLPSPRDGSACKRLNLFLRWMGRRDTVDPGAWAPFPSRLVVPLDTHMHRIARTLGFTARTQADLKTAMETTEGFGRIRPRDPVRYDFCLTRLGIRSDLREMGLGVLPRASAEVTGPASPSPPPRNRTW